MASYHTQVGFYAGDNDFFATAGVDAPPLHALRRGASGGNGVYAYGAGGFPVVASRHQLLGRRRLRHDLGGLNAPTVTARARPRERPAWLSIPGNGNVQRTGAAGDGVHALTGPRAPCRESQLRGGSAAADVRPEGQNLAASTMYTATVDGAQDAAGNTMTDVSWTFTTGAPAPPAAASFT